jgi:hypothetical protein
LKTIHFLTALFLFSGSISAQINAELLAGNKKATLDILFFRYVKNRNGQNTKFLFFNRNRAGIDYTITKTENLPQFGFTEAVSYSIKKLNGFAPVLATQIVNKGISPKFGIQYANIKKNATVFCWIVTETLENPNIDFFFLGRMTPKLSKKLHLFAQLELVNSVPTVRANSFSLIQRLRLGLKMNGFQFGTGLDLVQNGRKIVAKSNNFGLFLRYEF